MDKSKYNAIMDRYREELIISPEDLAASSLLDLNITADKLVPYIIEAQDLKLEPMLGSALLRKLQEDDRSFEYEQLAVNQVYKPLIHWALASYFEVAAYQVAQGGIYRHQPTDADPLTRAEIAGLIKSENYKALQYSGRMVSFLELYSDNYPEYTESVSDGIAATKMQRYAGGWNLESVSPTCNKATKDETYFDVVMYWGNNAEVNMGFDETTLSDSASIIPSDITIQPINSYAWIVSDVEIDLYQVGVEIPLGSFNDANQLTQTFVRGEQDSKFWIRINVSDTYESEVRFSLKKT